MAALSWLIKNPSPSTDDAFSRNERFTEMCARYPEEASKIVILNAFGSTSVKADARRAALADCGCASTGVDSNEGRLSTTSGSVDELTGSIEESVAVSAEVAAILALETSAERHRNKVKDHGQIWSPVNHHWTIDLTLCNSRRKVC